MKRTSLLAASGVVILLGTLGLVAWVLFAGRTEEEFAETAEARASRISAAFLRMHLAELRGTSLLLKTQLEGDELLGEWAGR